MSYQNQLGPHMQRNTTTHKLEHISNKKSGGPPDVEKRCHSHPTVQVMPEMRGPSNEAVQPLTICRSSQNWDGSTDGEQPLTACNTYQNRTKMDPQMQKSTATHTLLTSSQKWDETHIQKSTSTYSLQHISNQKWGGFWGAETYSHSQPTVHIKPKVRWNSRCREAQPPTACNTCQIRSEMAQ